MELEKMLSLQNLNHPEIFQDVIKTDFSCALKNMGNYLWNKFPELQHQLKEGFRGCIKANALYSCRSILSSSLTDLRIKFYKSSMYKSKLSNLYVVTGHKKVDKDKPLKDIEIFFVIQNNEDTENTPVTDAERVKTFLDTECKLYDLNLSSYNSVSLTEDSIIVPVDVQSTKADISEANRNDLTQIFHSWNIQDIEQVTTISADYKVLISLNSRFSSLMQQSHPLLIVQTTNFVQAHHILEVKIWDEITKIFEVMSFAQFVKKHFIIQEGNLYGAAASAEPTAANNAMEPEAEENKSITQLIEMYNDIKL